ncbi:MAG: carbohydrate kinase [Alistipes sp.]|nr:carbohydrate kinase [Alistipes sp.]
MDKDIKRTVIGIGEILWDVFPVRKVLGGAPANFAYHISQFGLEGIAVSAVGDDPFGKEIIETLEERGMKFLLEQVGAPTGTVQVELLGDGIPSYTITEEVAWDYIFFSDRMERLASEASAACFGTLAQRCPDSRETIRRFLSAMPEGSLRIFDINLRGDYYDKAVIEESLRLANMLKINDEEVKVVAGMFGLKGSLEQVAATLREKFGLDIVVLTKGTSGSYVTDGESESVLPTPQVDVADTVGAGDSFTAAFTAAYLHGWNIRDVHRLAVDVSAYICGCHGAMPVLPGSLRDVFM